MTHQNRGIINLFDPMRLYSVTWVRRIEFGFASLTNVLKFNIDYLNVQSEGIQEKSTKSSQRDAVHQRFCPYCSWMF